ncbi:MAG: CPBP family intramembrane metalloprotease [Saccharofermentans sp.]|nr:CPBP family intramembrane metalloprotease [Saccharofermentans sp.]
MGDIVDSKTSLKNTLGQLGWRFSIMWLIMHVVATILELLIMKLAPDFYDVYGGYVTLILTVVCIYMMAFPVLCLLVKRIPASAPQKHKLGFWKWCICALIMAGLTLMGIVVGFPIHAVLTMPFTGELTNEISDVMMSTNVFFRAFVVGILAPMFEELMFRKILIDRLRHYGEYVCVVLSGLMFGLLHGNFSQFFFATAIGMFFAFIYLRTGNIKNTILLHMTMNLVTSIITTELVMKVMPFVQSGNLTSTESQIWFLVYTVYIMGLLAIAVTGVVLFFVFLNKMKLKTMEGEISRKEIRKNLLTTPKLWIYYGCCLTSFVLAYLPNMIGM